MSSKTYVGTKASALRGTLLDKGTTQKLAEATSLDELVNRLKGTPYSTVLSNVSPPFAARRIETALRERLAEVHFSMMSSAGRHRILELYYLKRIAWDLKIALKAKALGKSFEESSEFLDMKAEELVGRRDLIIKILSGRDISEAVSTLSGSEFGEEAEKAFAAYQSKKELRFFDLFIDRAVLTAISKDYSRNFRAYSSPRATDVAGVGDLVSQEVDFYNLVSVLRAKLWGLPEQDIQALVILPTYRFTASALSRVASADSATEGLKVIEAILPMQLPQASGDEQLIDSVEDAFLNRIRETASKAFYWQGLGPGMSLALVKLLEFEVSNLAAIAIGIEARMETRVILNRIRI